MNLLKMNDKELREHYRKLLKFKLIIQDKDVRLSKLKEEHNRIQGKIRSEAQKLGDMKREFIDMIK